MKLILAALAGTKLCPCCALFALHCVHAACLKLRGDDSKGGGSVVMLLCRLEVGTESSVDRSKSIKSFLMALFEECGNTDIEVCSQDLPLAWNSLPHLAKNYFYGA